MSDRDWGRPCASAPREERCAWLVVVGEYDDGEEVIAECGAPIPGDSHDGLCARHTRGMPLEDYLAPFGPAWAEEMEERAW